MNTSPDVLFLTGDDTACPQQASELSRLGFHVHCYTGLSDLYAHLAQQPAPLVVLTGSLAIIDIAAAQLRAMHSTIGIVAVAAFRDSETRIHTLLSGADVCQPPDVSGLELAAVFQSLLRRIPEAASSVSAMPPAAAQPSETESANAGTETEEAVTGSWQLTSKGWALKAPSGKLLSLTTAERSLLLRFAHAPDKRVNRDAITTDAQADDSAENERRGRFIDVMISRMRRKAAAQRMRLPIKAVHGWGYMFTADLLVDTDIPDIDTSSSANGG